MKEKLRKRFIDEYARRGFRYGGMIPFCCLNEEGYELEIINQLRDEGFIQLRDCDDYSFELTIVERKRINEEYDLREHWLELEAASSYRSEIERELNKIGAV